MTESLLKLSGAQPSKPPKSSPIYISRTLTGLYTQRAALHDPSDIITSSFYGGRPDALLAGSNVELTNRLTLARRPGISNWTAATYPTPPLRAYDFHLVSGTILVLIDTQGTGTLALTSVANHSGSTTTYTGTITGGGSNAFVGMKFSVTGFVNGVNNVTNATCTASSGTTLTLVNGLGISESASASVSSAGAVWLDNQNGTKTLVLAKLNGAGQSYFQAVGDVCYIGDGVDLVKYTPDNLNGLLWNWGIVAPATQPSVNVVSSGSAAIAWAISTSFTTMGLLVDPNGNTEQLYSVNFNPASPNTTQIGLSSNGAPSFNLAAGDTTNDGFVTWTSQGQITLWTANTLYISNSPIWDPTTNCIFVQSHSSSRTSGNTKPAFNSTLGLSGARIDDTNTSGAGGGNARWECLGVVNVAPTAVLTWTKDTAFSQYTQPSGGTDPSNTNSAIVYPLVPFLSSTGQLCNGQATYLLGATTSGTTANTNYTPWTGIPSQSAGAITADNQLAWLNLGSATWGPSTPYFQWAVGGGVFSCIKDSNGNMQVCTTSGLSGGSAPTWGTNYGSLTQDGIAIWTCVGQAQSWTAATPWYLPILGFQPPSPSDPFGGTEVVASGFVQAVTQSGISNSSPPSWPVTIGHTVSDNTITWQTVAAYSQNSITWQKSHSYAYSFKCRTTTDTYVTTIPPGRSTPNGVATGGETGAVSTASPAFTLATPNTTGAVNYVSGVGSTDPQVDTIILWRDADGGGTSNMFWLTEFPAPQPIGGVAQPWTFADYLPDTPTSVFPGLNPLIPAPIDDENDPPPAGFLPMAYHFQRIWGGVDNQVYFSGGPDTLVGNPNEAFPSINFFPFTSTVTRCLHTAAGLIVFLTSDIEIIGGGPATVTFYSTVLYPNAGLLSYNALDYQGGEIYFFSADKQLLMLNPSLQLSRAGFPIGDQLAAFDATKVYVALYENGTDNAVYVADGSTGWFRLNPHQVPQNEPIWSPFATITGGSQMLQSVEVTPGVHYLLIGSTSEGATIAKRDTSVYTDRGSAYDANFTMGSIVLVHPGQIAGVEFVEMDFSGAGSNPMVSYLLNEISGAFTNFGASVYDPPQVYGTTISPSSYKPLRFYILQQGGLATARHLQLKVDFGNSDTVQNELFDLTIFGCLFVQ